MLFGFHDRIDSNILVEMNMNANIIIFEFLKYNSIEYLLKGNQANTFIQIISNNCKIGSLCFKLINGIQ